MGKGVAEIILGALTMKLVGNILLLLGTIIGLVALLFILTDRPDATKVGVLILCGISICVSFFIRTRAKENIGLLKVTENEKAELQEMGREFTPRKLFGQLIGSFGGLFIMVAFWSSFHGVDSGKVKFGAAVSLALFGVFLVLCAALLLRSPMFEGKSALWFPAVSGFACSCSVLVFAAGMLVKFHIRHSDAMDLSDYMLLFSAPCGVVSAVVCVITGFSVLFAKQPTRHEDSALNVETNP